MAAASSVTIEGAKTGLGTGSKDISVGPLENTDAPLATTAQAFSAATFAAVTFPGLVGSSVIKGVIIKPPSTNSGAITLKGVTGDTGIPIHKTEATMIRFDSVTATNFGILTVSAITIEFEWL
jgi:hypothetical protein